MKIPIRTARIDLDGDYAGIWVEARTNPPMRAYEEMSSGELPRMYGALGQIMRGSNLTDEEDRPLDVRDPETWRDVPLDLIKAIADKWTEAVNLPLVTKTDSSPPSTDTATASPPSTPA